jgi:hypothetical protein
MRESGIMGSLMGLGETIILQVHFMKELLFQVLLMDMGVLSIQMVIITRGRLSMVEGMEKVFIWLIIYYLKVNLKII